ncbi:MULTISPECIES: PspC domain-containing protein [Arenibacter]|uniref:PspC domain-containing protein n=1 Tax=Arenibacter TaxID=178469 RepID=UPI001C07D6C5|nr:MULTISPECIES: PspC domain-containing protein [Arenibacter]MBU2906298.1 PspC domain-containing protein [Arenibacter algicola]MCK0135167.1 PspC domain-containing protein [Arenibacter sp. S6351L]
MNKTININLANLFFHIDEVAYTKLQRYLEAIKRSFANTSGSDEIIADIEARIAELFHEKMENERQVITEKEVDEVIGIMGQPEDYMVDEDIFEDQPKTSKIPGRVRKLYRDIDNKYIGGVSAGLGHYFGIDALWVRLLWILLTIFSWGGFVFIYGLLWILIPEAVTTAQKLDMRGEAVNISNIEKKVKEGFDDVAEKVKNVDYEKVGSKVKDGSRSFFNAIADIIMFFFKIIGKFIGIILIIIGAAGIVALFVGMFTVGILDIVHLPGIDFYYMVNSTNTPVWLVSVLGFFAIGIPFFFLMYLGLKILVNNLKSIGNIAKFTLLGMWLIAIILLAVFGIRQAAAHAYTGSVSTEKELAFQLPEQPIKISLKSSRLQNNGNGIGINGVVLDYTENGEEVLVSEDIRINLKMSKDSIARLEVRKNANGNTFKNATETANNINYGYEIQGNTIILDDFLTTAKENKYRDQEVRIYLYLPVGTVLTYESDNNHCWIMSAPLDRNMSGCKMTKYQWKMEDSGELICLNCPVKEEDNDDNSNGKIIINEDGVDIDLKGDGDSFKLKIDDKGVQIKTNETKSTDLKKDTVQ